MKKKRLVNTLYILSVLLMLVAVVFQVMNKPMEIFYPLGLLAYAAAEMVKSQNKDAETNQ